MIPYGHQSLDRSDIESVRTTLEGEWLTQGPDVDRFEEALAAAVDARYAVAMSSGTAALHAAVAVSGLGVGDEVVTSPFSFVASANCILYSGADVLFEDIEPDTWNMRLDRIPKHLAGAIVVHYAGLPADLSRMSHRPRVVIEDAAHALGAHTPHGPIGNCAFSDMCVFSFHPVKAITTGEGGAVTTNSSTLAERLRVFRNQGITRQGGWPAWYYEVKVLGFNYRLSDIHASLGASQIRRLEAHIERRNRLAERYDEAFASSRVMSPPRAGEGWRHARHIYPIKVSDRDRCFARLRESGIGAQVHYVPIYAHPLYASRGHSPADYPVTEEISSSVLSIPLFPGLTETQQEEVIAAVERNA